VCQPWGQLHTYGDVRPGLWHQQPGQGSGPSSALASQNPEPPQPQQAYAPGLPHRRQPQKRPEVRHVCTLGKGANFPGTAHTAHPQRGHREGQPEPCRPCRDGPWRLLPWPPTSFGAFAALFVPGPQSILTGSTPVGGQGGEEKPGRVMSCAPPRYPRALQVAVMGAKRRAPPAPAMAHLADQRAWPAGRHCAPWLIRKNGCQPRRTMRRNSQRA